MTNFVPDIMALIFVVTTGSIVIEVLKLVKRDQNK